LNLDQGEERLSGRWRWPKARQKKGSNLGKADKQREKDYLNEDGQEPTGGKERGGEGPRAGVGAALPGKNKTKKKTKETRITFKGTRSAYQGGKPDSENVGARAPKKKNPTKGGGETSKTTTKGEGGGGGGKRGFKMWGLKRKKNFHYWE